MSENNSNEIVWADSLQAASEAATGSVGLIVIDEKVDGQPGLYIAKEMIKVNAMANLSLVSDLNPEEFHEASEGLGILAQLPIEPDAKDAVPLLNALTALL
ncbi:MAG: hypothetical protein QG578_1973 [Thermodesulfobacteriota bacterium]|nr:hypothetical protein [Thermodesulfobacteriota bacterium]